MGHAGSLGVFSCSFRTRNHLALRPRLVKLDGKRDQMRTAFSRKKQDSGGHEFHDVSFRENAETRLSTVGKSQNSAFIARVIASVPTCENAKKSYLAATQCRMG